MKPIAMLWTGLNNLLRHHRVQLRLSLRVTVAALLSLALARFFHFSLPLWAVLTAVIVTQTSVGRSLKATLDYLGGTIGGAIYGGSIALLIPHSSEIALLGVLALAVAPLALIAAVNPSLTAAPITAIIVLLVPEMTHATPMASAIDRVLEVTLGGITGFCVSLFLLPYSAHRLFADTAAVALDHMARALGELLTGLSRGLNANALHGIQLGVGETLSQLQTVNVEAERERSAHLAFGPHTAPHLRTLSRLRHDMVMLGRAALIPLPAEFGARLEPTLAQITTAFTQYLRLSRDAILARAAPPPLDPVESALAAYEAEIAVLRREGLTQSLSVDAAERLFAIGFALEQMHLNFKDLALCIAEWAQLSIATDNNVVSRL